MGLSDVMVVTRRVVPPPPGGVSRAVGDERTTRTGVCGFDQRSMRSASGATAGSLQVSSFAFACWNSSSVIAPWVCSWCSRSISCAVLVPLPATSCT